MMNETPSLIQAFSLHICKNHIREILRCLIQNSILK